MARETVEKAEEAAQFMNNLSEKEARKLAAPERESSPQLDWPEAEGGPGGEMSERTYLLRLNYRLTMVGFALDAARGHLESEVDTATWLKFKQSVLAAKGDHDAASKVGKVIDLESRVRDFALSLGTTEADYDAARTD